MITVSTRQPVDDEAVVYSGERGKEYQLNRVDVLVPPSHQRGHLELPGKTPNAEKSFVVSKLSTIDEEASFELLTRTVPEGRVLVFVHGYNVKYSEAVYRLAQISKDLNIHAFPILFTWPSRGTVLSYLYDKESATFSRDSLERLFARLTNTPEVKEIVVLGHSMGAWLTMEALRQSAIRNKGISSKFIDVILASPDIDQDVFVQQFNALGTEKPHFTFLTTEDDNALRISAILSGGITRVGRLNPRSSEVQTWLKGHTNVTVVDLSELERGGTHHHSKYAENKESLDFVASSLRSENRSNGVSRTLSRPSQAVLVTLSRILDVTGMKN
ncbi:alpha/beta hydrolase [Kordiimonas sp. SCSIO 12610]|uniref:alpha/beta hydrolase n=1 Tax=Kordiimonas sp. SCSIO 12610 TaxID=2829597 RepID=UPI00210A9367|nr:alpha/beta fold hydrolase [Kordiimonas sp. SCSIO 12610]UTW55673.1 alpha/beta fold hydrolase [Kordiimonas sp. SCSIO 12610]